MATFFGKTLGPESLLGGTGGAAGAGDDDDDDPEACCPTCLEPFADGDPPVFTRCGHRFHLQCLYAWLERKSTCPLCGSAVEFDEGGGDDGGDGEGEGDGDGGGGQGGGGQGE